MRGTAHKTRNISNSSGYLWTFGCAYVPSFTVARVVVVESSREIYGRFEPFRQPNGFTKVAITSHLKKRKLNGSEISRKDTKEAH